MSANRDEVLVVTAEQLRIGYLRFNAGAIPNVTKHAYEVLMLHSDGSATVRNPR